MDKHGFMMAHEPILVFTHIWLNSWINSEGWAVRATLRPWLEVKPIHLLYSDLALIKLGWDMILMGYIDR
jgi:hypothetical protein